MSSDAKIWPVDWAFGCWSGVHDGPCKHEGSEFISSHHEQDQTLSELVDDIEDCMGQALYWEVRIYPSGKAGLVGYLVPRSLAQRAEELKHGPR